MAALITTPPVNGTLCHQEIELRGSRYALCVRSRSVGMLDGMHTVTHTLPRSLLQAFLHAVVSTSGRIHGELLRLLFILADRQTTPKTKRFPAYQDLAVSVSLSSFSLPPKGH